MAYLISYDIVSPDTNRTEVELDIATLGNVEKFLTTTFLVVTSLDIEEVHAIATKSLKSGDKMLICETSKPVKGRLYKSEWNWINQNLS